MAESSVQILLIDPDPIFRLGLRIALERSANLHVIGEADNAAAGLALVQQRLELRQTPTSAPTAPLSLVVLEPTLQIADASPPAYLFQQLKRQYPQLPLLLLGQPNWDVLTLARQRGVEGFAVKGSATDVLVAAVRQLAAGERSWPPEVQRRLVTGSPKQPIPATKPSLITRWHYHLIAPGLREMDAHLADLQSQLNRPDIRGLERAILAGQYREVRLSRWLVGQILPAGLSQRVAQPASAESGLTGQPSVATHPNRQGSTQSSLTAPVAGGLEPLPHLGTLLLEAVDVKTQFGLQNLTGDVLELDILRREQRQALLSIVRRNFAALLAELRRSQVTLAQLPQRQRQFVLDLWQLSTTEFFGRYATLPDSESSLAGVDREPDWRPVPGAASVPQSEPGSRWQRTSTTVQVTLGTGEVTTVTTLLDALLQEQESVQAGILTPIPLVQELLEHLLFQLPLMVDNATYAPGTPAAMRQAEAILENLLLQVANAVVQPLLNQFADQEPIKQRYYDRQVISSRDIAQFRNRLSWKYRVRSLVVEPQEIFESRRSLLTLTDRGIEKVVIYSPRGQELRQLRGFPLFITLALEVRDAVAPPLRRTVAFLGQALIYLLTQVVGRGLGLIGRGILQGIGSSWQDLQVSRRNSQNS